MKKKICFFLFIIMMMSVVTTVYAASYTLPYKMRKQLDAGSGLKGSFIIRSNAAAESNPFLYALQNAEFNLRGIRSDGNLHYYIYQSADGEEMNELTEFSILDQKYYLRSDLLDPHVYLLPDLNKALSLFIHSDGENPPVAADLIRMIVDVYSRNESTFSTESLEKLIELWISSFKSENTIQSTENSAPRLTQVFRIPVEAMYNTIAKLIETVSLNDTAMTYIQSFLSEEQARLYLNPDLAYYYLDAMKQLDLRSDIVFSRTVSTLGEMIHSSLMLPADESMLGFSTIQFESSELRNSIYMSGEKGAFYVNVPTGFDLQADSFEDVILFAMTSKEHPEKNLSLNIAINKTLDKYDDEEETMNHETYRYTINAHHSSEGFPEEVIQSVFPETETIQAVIDMHLYSKLPPGSQTLLDFSCEIKQGDFFMNLIGNARTSSVKNWVFSPFDVNSAVNAVNYTTEDFKKLKDDWIQAAMEKLVRTPDEIRTDSIPETNTQNQ